MNKYYILDMQGNIISIPFDSAEKAEEFGLSENWDRFHVIQLVKYVKA